MSNVAVPVEFLSKVAEYIKVASEQTTKLEADIVAKNQKIAELSKQEKTAAVTLSETECKQAADKLVTAGLLSAEHKDATAKSLSDPKNALSALTKVADAYARRPLGVVAKVEEKKQTKTASALEEAADRFAASIGVRN